MFLRLPDDFHLSATVERQNRDEVVNKLKRYVPFRLIVPFLRIR
jgi:hypothetical protein